MQFLQANIINIVNDVLKQHVDIKLNDVLEKTMKGFYIYIYIYIYIYMRGVKVFRLILLNILLNIDWHRNCHSLHASSLKFIICISFLSLPIYKLFSTHALSSVHSQQLTHCKNKNTQHDQKFNNFFGGVGGSLKIPPSTTQIKKEILPPTRVT